MTKFLAGILLGLTLTQLADTRTILITRLDMETSPKPTGTIRHWTIRNTGGVCSADLQSPFGKMMTRYDDESRIIITFEPFTDVTR